MYNMCTPPPPHYRLPLSPLFPATPITPYSRTNHSPRAREFTIGEAFKADSGPVSAEEKKRSLAWLTIKSVGIISAALSFGTVALYWLAGEYFVHLGPREYPGSASRSAGVERTVEGKGGGEAAAAPRRTIGSSTTRDAFSFEGFPDAGKSDVVPPDF